jgi:hypothetical protein|tara:strand:- start:4173 stop:4388 length:216 start_codon:yes stop_codon:yes gene_type:complete
MFALLQNEYAMYLIIVLLVLGIVIGKFIGFKKFFGFFAGSGERVETAKAKTAAKATTAKASTAKATAESAD